MKLYSNNENYKLYHGNMLDMLEVIEPNSIDSIITDPPYELNFMGKGWDNSGIAFQKETWQKCYEVLKPGGYLLAFGGSRTFHKIACAIEDAGFEIRDTIMWLYGSGFPKSMNISIAIDKSDTKDFRKQIGKIIKQARIKKNMTMDELCQKLKLNNEGHGGMINHYENGRATPTIKLWNKICEILDINNINDYEENKKGRYKIVGEIKNPITWFGNGLKKEATTDLAKQWQGWGTALKPSFEPIIVARKPFKGSLVDNVIEYGVGGINIDECRVSNTSADSYDLEKRQISKATGSDDDGHFLDQLHNQDAKHGVTNLGRFPANTILTYDETDFDEVCGGFPQSKGASSQNNYSNGHIYRGQSLSESKTSLNGYREWYNDNGSASRYFYCAKASKKDRDEGLDEFEEKLYAQSNGSQTAIAKGEEYHKDGIGLNQTKLRKNTHPTVKPTELMQYLIRLVNPNGATILDPFNGSGSTGKAVMYENRERNKNYKYIGIELTEEYLPISKARIEYVCNLPEEKDLQMTIFDFIGDKENENN